MEHRQQLIRKIRDDTGVLGKCLEVNIPIYFFWDADGEFLGVEIYPPEDLTFTPYCRKLAREVMRAVNGEDSMPKREVRRRTSIPDVFKRAIKEIQGDGGK